MTVARLKETVEKLRELQRSEFDFDGIRITINYVNRAKHPKNWVIATHYHPWFEFNYISKGSVYTTIEGKEFLIGSGMSYMIPPNASHSHRASGEGDDGICIRFGLSADSGNEVTEALSRAFAEAFESGLEKIPLSGGIHRRRAEFAAWLMGIFEQRSAVKTVGDAPKNTFAAQAELYLEEYYAEKIGASDIANALNTSYRTLARKFKEETGMTVTEKLAEIRTEKAKQMLVSTKLSMREIAQKTGYENEFYFSKAFKRREKIPPNDYRKRNFVVVETEASSQHERFCSIYQKIR